MKLLQLAIIPITLTAAAALSAPEPPARTPEKPGVRKLTFARDVATIIYNKCAVCHHAGEVAPFPLMTYADVSKRAKQIALVTTSRLMPPWKADSHGEFENERRLTGEEIETISQWADAGAPMGDPKDLPATPRFRTGWKLGKPDLVVQMPAKYCLAAEGRDVYRCFVIRNPSNEDHWISGMEFHPGNHQVVHHILAYIDTHGRARKLAGKDPASSYTSSGGGPGFIPDGGIGGWAPGNDPELLPDGIGMLLPKKCDIVLEVHYHKSGKPETDQSKAAIYYCKAPVDKSVHTVLALKFDLNIPPGEAKYIATGASPITEPITVMDVTPHMHLLGQEMTVTAKLPDGTEVPMVKVPKWDFNWQISYDFKQPLKLPAGTTINLAARFDNSADNPRNPSRPPKRVKWGEQTTDEMCIAFIDFTVDAEHLTKGIKGKKASIYEF